MRAALIVLFLFAGCTAPDSGGPASDAMPSTSDSPSASVDAPTGAMLCTFHAHWQEPGLVDIGTNATLPLGRAVIHPQWGTLGIQAADATFSHPEGNLTFRLYPSRTEIAISGPLQYNLGPRATEDLRALLRTLTNGTTAEIDAWASSWYLDADGMHGDDFANGRVIGADGWYPAKIPVGRLRLDALFDNLGPRVGQPTDVAAGAIPPRDGQQG